MAKSILTELELKYIKENFRDKLPKTIADHLGISVSRVRNQVELFEVESVETPKPPPVQINTKEIKERPSVMQGMKSKDVDGVLVMTPAASERGDEFLKTYKPAKFDEFTRKIYRESK